MVGLPIRRLSWVPLVLGAICYGAVLSRIYERGAFGRILMLLSGQALVLFIIVTFLRLPVACPSRKEHRAKRGFDLILSLILLLGVYPLNTVVIHQQDRRFMARIDLYKQAVDSIAENRGGKVGSFWPSDTSSALAKEVRVFKTNGGDLRVYFIMATGFLAPRLAGYAYNSADKWDDEFIRMFGQPKKLTKNWYRI